MYFQPAFLLATVFHFCNAVQHCNDNIDSPTKFYLAVNIFNNETSRSKEFYFTLATPFNGRKGWQGIGSGTGMDHSLMFVTYPGPHKNEVIFSPRTTTDHNPPHKADTSIPSFQLTRTSINNGVSTARWTCFACKIWSGNKFDSANGLQTFIFAENHAQPAFSSSPSRALDRNDDYGIFVLDLSTAVRDSSSERTSPDIVLDDLSSDKKGNSPQTPQMNLHFIHGIIMYISFGALLPLGVLAISWKPLASFRVHWATQAVFASLFFLGIYIAISASLAHSWIVLGYNHHRQYLMREAQKSLGRMPRAKFSMRDWHKRLGRLLSFLRAVNIMVGSKKTHDSSIIPFLWACFFFSQVVTFYILVVRERKKESELQAFESLQQGGKLWGLG